MYRNWVLAGAVSLLSFIVGCGTTSSSAGNQGLLSGGINPIPLPDPTPTPAPTPPPTPAVTIAVSPDASALNGDDSQQFQANVNGASDQGVVWLVNGVEGGSTPAGTISPSGLYVAPPTDTDMTLTITGRSRADLSKSADAVVMVHPRRRVATISISPTAMTLTAGSSQQFQANVSGATDQSVTWMVNGVTGGSSATGTISNSGLYLAPSTSGQLALSVTATSNADPSKSASASVTVNPLPPPPPPIAISVAPVTVALNAGASQQFIATVSGATDQSVTWLVNDVTGGSSATGTISSSGLYLAPSTSSQLALSVTARSNADSTKSATATVTVNPLPPPPPPPVTISIAPTTLTLTAGSTQQFQTTVSGANDQSVTWLVNGTVGGTASVGTISPSGLYSAPTTTSQLNVTVTARSNADATVSASATATVNPAPPPTVVTISPTMANLTSGTAQQFSASVTGPTDKSVTWLVNGTVGGGSAAGTISTSGLYSAPTTTSQLNVTVTARSNADATVSASAAVTVNPLPPPTVVTISPTTANLTSGNTQQFSASVTGPTDQSVTWLVNGTIGGSSTNGIISTSGLYSAPTTTSQLNVTVTARSNSDATAFANSAVTVSPQPSSSSDLYISATGSDSNACTQTAPCASFTHVDSVVKPGQTVHILPGTYNLTSSTCIATAKSGTSSAPITWQSDVYGAAKINGNGACLYAWHVTGSYIRIFGFDMTGVQDNGSASFLLSEGAGGNVEIAYNTVHDLNGSFGAAVDMEPYGNGNYTGAPCSVHDNVFYNIAPGANVTFNHYSMYITCGTNTTIYNNLIYNEGSIGIHCWHAANQVHIYNNTIDHANIGILVGTGDGGGQTNAYFDVTNNIVTNSGSYGIMAEDSSPATISPTSVFRNNLVYNNPTDWYYNNSGTDRTISSAFSLLGTVAGNDPQFVAPGSGNYHLSASSPAAGAGLQTTYVPALDLSGTSRSNPPAIGAYEH